MTERFFERPVLNSPYERPSRHWELDEDGQPTQKVIERRRQAEFITPIPKPRKRKGAGQQALVFDQEAQKLGADGQQYDLTAIINGVRQQVDRWRELPEAQWQVTLETARLLRHWRHHHFSGVRPFFCQVEAAETAIWLTEVATRAGRNFLDHLANANDEANPELPRMALKLATGADKTTVMAMLIAWQTVNAVRRPQSSRFTRGFLVVTPGITIKDRLRVLQPNDPDSYYQSRELVPNDMRADLEKAKIVITNYHAFKLRERMELSKGGRSLLQGRGESIATLETEGQMLQRVMPELMGLKSILVLNDEAHHCYREKSGEAEEEALRGNDRKEEARFSVYQRQNLNDDSDFSCGISYLPSGGPSLTLARYNGPGHPHHDISYRPHIHRASERAIAAGKKPESEAEETDRFENLEGALACLIADFNLTGLDIPKDHQMRML